MATVVDGGRTSMSTYNGCGSAINHHSPPPPIPARLPRPATALGHGDAVDAGNGYLSPVVVQTGPPLPPRRPLRRSWSLTQRAVPQPGRDVDERQRHVTEDRPGHEPTLDDVLASLRRSRVDSPQPAPLSPALSAPLLGQVF